MAAAGRTRALLAWRACSRKASERREDKRHRAASAAAGLARVRTDGGRCAPEHKPSRGSRRSDDEIATASGGTTKNTTDGDVGRKGKKRGGVDEERRVGPSRRASPRRRSRPAHSAPAEDRVARLAYRLAASPAEVRAALQGQELREREEEEHGREERESDSRGAQPSCPGPRRRRCWSGRGTGACPTPRSPADTKSGSASLKQPRSRGGGEGRKERTPSTGRRPFGICVRGGRWSATALRPCRGAREDAPGPRLPGPTPSARR